MAVADDRQAGCEGCGRTVPLEDLTTVTMPDGERVACCPRCEPHAREAARKCSSLDQRRAACDGCTGTYLETELEDIVLEDGTVLACCPSCAREAPEGDADTASAEHGEHAAADRDDEAEGSGEETLCMQCNEWVTAELFRVTTIDDRTEKFCPTCKERAEEDGIVKDVDIRKTNAREVLGVEADATDDEIKAAFHRQVKRAHPDRESGSKSAFKLVREAYERLTEDD
ncbi:heat shock protein DnaJ domain protein [Haloterrigena turkmenica DSM 5511]|uniref:Heat shock protein DnaJ domain protein n=1 Tax=Haloterrigena turkmenica (strain ATCC 51198 / DSM 5511 / JCM 9101 / NCIMB 13204 / VKM B-1734 / 4k) TaxID=543526 RepID=D2RT61_HALTV|nr:J domain-containing protein [Haloterrigena turkmenica]ADB60941.1 heat shock protein DnaJ domain protein [Haloterrigena turkmenica DSM 5511]